MYIYKYILCILYLAHMELIPHQVGEYGWIQPTDAVNYGGLIPPKHRNTKWATNSREHQISCIFNDWNKTEQTTKNYTIPAVLQIGYFQQGIKYRLELNQGITFYKKLVGYTNDRKGDRNGTAKCKGWILPNAVDFNLKQGSLQNQPKQCTMLFSTGNPLKESYICI